MLVGLRRVCASTGNVLPRPRSCARVFGPVGRRYGCRAGSVSAHRRRSTAGAAGRNEARSGNPHVASRISRRVAQSGWAARPGTRGRSLLAVLELNGACGLAAGYGAAESPLAAQTSLATTTITDGRGLPFSSLNCTALTRSVSATLAQEAARDAIFFMAAPWHAW